MSNYFYCIRSEELLYAAERDLLTTAKFFFLLISFYNGLIDCTSIISKLNHKRKKTFVSSCSFNCCTTFTMNEAGTQQAVIKTPLVNTGAIRDDAVHLFRLFVCSFVCLSPVDF